MTSVFICYVINVLPSRHVFGHHKGPKVRTATAHTCQPGFRKTVKWVTCGYRRTNCCFASWTGELPSLGSYFVACLCFCPLCEFSFNTRSMKSQHEISQHEIRHHGLGKTIGNYKQSEIMAPSKSIPDSLLRSSWTSSSWDRQATNCHEWRSAQCQAACLEREPEFRPPDDQQDFNNL